MTRALLLALVLLVLGAGSWAYLARDAAPAARQWRSATIDRGPLVRSIAASGTLRPVTLVKVGTRVSGSIARIHADFNQQVRKGEVLAEIDTALIRAALAQIAAESAAARADLALAEVQHARNQRLVNRGFLAPSALDESRAALAARRAQLAQLAARRQQEETNLEHATVRAPIDGVVVARDVDVGQTVAASFQTPTLFEIAGDLTRMQIETRVAEADVGELRIGQPARFTVDAHPGATRHAQVRQIRLNPSIEQNVVTYNVVLDTDNADRRLLPGMTAQVSIELERRDNALRAPNAALRFRPPEAVAPAASGAQLYRLEHGQPVAVAVTLGMASDTHTELIDAPLQAGDAVLTGIADDASAARRGNFRLRLH